METLYGIHSVREALKAGKRKFKKLFVEKKKTSGRLKEIIKLAESNRVAVKSASADYIAKASGADLHQGACLEAGPCPMESLNDLIRIEKESSSIFFLLLDNIVDPGNLGAILRTALCAGVDGVAMTRDRSAGPSPSVSRASAGAMEHIRMARVTNMANTIKTLKKKKFWIFGADAKSELSVFSIDWKGRAGLVIGGEEKGLRPLVKKKCDALVSIPLKGPVQSLNASAAAAVVLYEAARQRGFN